MKEITESARASIRQLQQKIFRKKMCLWAVIIALFILNLALLTALIRNHGACRRINVYACLPSKRFIISRFPPLLFRPFLPQLRVND
jgi:hypothetical protein